ncbi:hypothetical protein JTE90_026446 [Oedothorax gibbosus]|uniref:ZP domain-containing protein n=1 Tax=Oedothorax gibbosus TaxID=931172 RepID=A0AAV6VQV2_9ARAC|nr:hypothetical protein JTE90_026446 [Oedothorax gibbosus]
MMFPLASFVIVALSLTRVAYSDDILQPVYIPSTTTNSFDDKMNTEGTGAVKNDSLAKNQEPAPYISLTKDLTIEDTSSSSEFAFTEPMMPHTIANSPVSVISVKDGSVTEGSSVVTFQETSDSPTMSKRIEDEEALGILSTERVHYEATSKQEEALNLATETLTLISTTPSSVSKDDNPTDASKYLQEITINETTVSLLSKTSTPSADTVKEKHENTPQNTFFDLNRILYAVQPTQTSEHNDSLKITNKESQTDFYMSTTHEYMDITKEHFEISKASESFVSSTEASYAENHKQTKSESVAGNDSPIFITDHEDIYNSTRFPKRIQGARDRYPAEGRVRPARPDPGYTQREDQIDIVRPYRPDTPIQQYPYYRPTPDNRTPVIRENTEYTRPARPDPDTQRASFKPNYSFTKATFSTSDAPTAKPYRPSFNRPYVPQGSFGRPYRPDFHRPASRPNEDGVYKASTSGASTHDAEIFEHSRADYEYTRQSESGAPSMLKAKPSTDAAASSTEEDDIKIGFTPNIQTARPYNYYPKPGGSFTVSDTAVKPFSGTVISDKNLTRVEYIKADCFDNYMKVTMRFNGTFDGLIYSSGYAQDSSCSYVNGSGRNHYEFFIRLNRCGTLGQQEVSEDTVSPVTRRRQERAQYLVNTVTVQYNAVIEEDIDEHFRVTCEYGYDFWKTVTFPVINVESASVKLRTGSPVVFTLPPPQCNMEVRNGFGPSGNRITGPVNVGDPITLVIHMKSESTGFDILVSNCFAHNGAQKRLQLIDSHGCVVEEKLISPFRGVSSPDRSQQVTLYSYLKAFRFTGSPALYLECDVHMCHGSCPPQRCYWRSLYKRSAEQITTPEDNGVVSESVSLFQALEVRHAEVDSPLALRKSQWTSLDDMICIGTGGFAALSSCVLLLLLLTTSAAVCMCLRMRKMKFFMETPDTKRFMEFDNHIPLK